MLGKLDGEAGDAARAALDQDRLAALELERVVDRIDRGEAGERERRGVDMREARGLLRHHLGLDRDLLGVGALLPGRQHREDLVADLEIGHALAQRRNRAGEVAAEHIGKFQRRAVTAVAHPPVGAVDGRGHDVHHDLARAFRRVRQVAVFEDLGSAVPLDIRRFHRAVPSRFQTGASVATTGAEYNAARPRCCGAIRAARLPEDGARSAFNRRVRPSADDLNLPASALNPRCIAAGLKRMIFTTGYPEAGIRPEGIKVMRGSRNSLSAFALSCPFVHLCRNVAKAQTIYFGGGDIALKSGESAELAQVYYIGANCKSLLRGTPAVEILDGPPGVTASIKEESVVPGVSAVQSRCRAASSWSTRRTSRTTAAPGWCCASTSRRNRATGNSAATSTSRCSRDGNDHADRGTSRSGLAAVCGVLTLPVRPSRDGLHRRTARALSSIPSIGSRFAGRS